MKNIAQITELLAASLLLATGVFAGELRNEDGKRYEVKVSESSTTRNTSIEASTTMTNICSDCEIEVIGVGKIRIKGSERAIIKNGKLSKQ